VTQDRQARFEAALAGGLDLVERALAVDPDDGEAYLARASMKTFTDLAAAEADYRRGLELSPNSAKGYHGLAVVLYETPARRDEALELLDRARKLDPLQPAYDVTKAVFMLYERGDVQAAENVLLDVLRREPDYQPALARLTEIQALLQSQSADGIESAERALELDPLAEDLRRVLIRAYLDVDDVHAAEQVADTAPQDLSVRTLPILLYQHEWLRAGEAAYDSVARQTVSPKDSALVVAAIRMHARTSGNWERARAALESMSGVQWNVAGKPMLPARPGLRESAIGLVDVLLALGREQQGRQLLALILGQMHREIAEEGRSEFWYYKAHPIVLALGGDRDAAIAMLQRSAASKYAFSDGWYLLEVEPAYDGLRQDPRFQAILRDARTHRAEQRQELERRRAAGRVPDRSGDRPGQS
jgi:tetratricopeptide (TPR) repeat protein